MMIDTSSTGIPQVMSTRTHLQRIPTFNIAAHEERKTAAERIERSLIASQYIINKLPSDAIGVVGQTFEIVRKRSNGVRLAFLENLLVKSIDKGASYVC